MNIAKRLKEAMYEAGDIKPHTLAKKAKVGYGTIYRILHGNQETTTVGILTKLAKALNKPLLYFCEENDQKVKVILYLKEMTEPEVSDLLKHLHKEELYKKVSSQ